MKPTSRTVVRAGLAGGVLCAWWLAGAAAVAQPAKRSADSVAQPMIGKLIVKLRNPKAGELLAPLNSERMSALSSSAGARLHSFRQMSGAATVLRLDQPVPLQEARAIAARLAASPEVQYAHPDYPVRAFQTPPDNGWVQRHWHYYPPSEPFTSGGKTATAAGGANLPGAWSVTQGNSAIIVAVIDTGIVMNHPEFVGKFAATPGYDFIASNAQGLPANFVANDGDGRDADANDPGDWIEASEQTNFQAACDDDNDPNNNVLIESSWHGTHMAATIAGVWGNGVGGSPPAGTSTAGIAPNVRIQSLRALGKCGGSSSDVIDAIRWAAGIAAPAIGQTWQNVGVTIGANPTPARIINMSLGSSAGSCSQAYQDAVTDVISFGTLVIAASGNDGVIGVSQPANCSGVLAVTAHTINGDNADYSNVGPQVGISAPGGGTPTLLPSPIVSSDAGYFTWSAVMFGARGPTSFGSPPNNASSGPAIGGFTGTSSASAHVSGVAALLWSALPGASAGQIRGFIVNSARSHPANGYCGTGQPGAGSCGPGLLDAGAAMALAVPPSTGGGGGGGGALPIGQLLLLAAAAFAARLRRER